MRVLVFANMYPDVGGRGPFVKDQVEDLRSLGYEVDVLAFDGMADTLNYLRAFRQLHARLRAHDYDLVHAHYGLTGAVAMMQRQTPVVTTFHGSDCNGQSRWQSAVSWGVARRTTPVFVSRELAGRMGLSEAAVIPAGVDVHVFHPADRAESRRKLGWDLTAPYALLPGRRSSPLKRADLFDAALDAARASEPELRGASLDRLTRREVALAMAAANVTVMTSDYEGSPITIKESLASLTPVVAVRVGDVATMVDGLPGCAVVERNPTQLAAAIGAALSAPRDGVLRDRALEYSRERVASRLASVYEAVVAERS